MNTLTNTLLYKIKEPTPEYFYLKQNKKRGESELNVNFKQVARILQHLCRDLNFFHPQLKMPSSSTLQALCYNACADLPEEAKHPTQIGWQQLINAILKSIHKHTDVGLDEQCHFTQLDGKTPLFPNPEQFDEWDAHRLSQALLLHLDREFN